MRYGLWGSEYTTQYEIASLSKTMTASLLLEAIRRGEVTAQTPVSALVPEIVSPVRDVTLEQLVSHRFQDCHRSPRRLGSGWLF
ncbi:serine hydrolase [Klebsiella variicola subsp. variicola]|nr:serine hydrolase [Klebsiella variicola subsp. variicola]